MVSGDARLQRQVRASFFALLASVRGDTPWAPSPGGLSSDGYNGHVFWDSETWMYPSLLATEPAIARASLRYRFDRLRAARANATKTGWSGARYPWESALRGSEETPAFAKTGQLEIHVNADISLAVHQYWLATGDRHWLATRGWPMLKGIADYYADRATRNADGSYSIRDVIPPDEYAEGVDDSVYTNMSAARRAPLRTRGRPRAGPARACEPERLGGGHVRVHAVVDAFGVLVRRDDVADAVGAIRVPRRPVRVVVRDALEHGPAPGGEPLPVAGRQPVLVHRERDVGVDVDLELPGLGERRRLLAAAQRTLPRVPRPAPAGPRRVGPGRPSRSKRYRRLALAMAGAVASSEGYIHVSESQKTCPLYPSEERPPGRRPRGVTADARQQREEDARAWRCSRASPETTMSERHRCAHAASEARLSPKYPRSADCREAINARPCGCPASEPVATPTCLVIVYVWPRRTSRSTACFAVSGSPEGTAWTGPPTSVDASVAGTPRPWLATSTH